MGTNEIKKAKKRNEMPIGRIILKSISESKKLSILKTDGARLLYTWLIPHLDINGNCSGDPKVIKGKIFTRLNKSTKTITGYLQDMENMGLIFRYEVNGDIFLNVPDFVEKQPKLNPEREGKTTISPPTQEQVRSRSGVNHNELPHNNKVKLNKDELKEKGEKPIAQKPDIETEFEEFWTGYRIMGNSKDVIGDKQAAKKAYKSLRGKISKEELLKAFHGEADYLKYEKINNNFDKRKKYASTWLRSGWETHMDFKYKARL